MGLDRPPLVASVSYPNPNPDPTPGPTPNPNPSPNPNPNPNSTPIMSRCAPNHEKGVMHALIGNFLPDNGPNSLLYFTKEGKPARCAPLSKTTL